MTSSSKRTVRCSVSESAGLPLIVARNSLQLGHAVVEPLDDGIDLGAEAGREDDRLGEVGLVPQPSERLGQRALGHGHPLEEIEGGLALLEADDDHRHRATAFGRTLLIGCPSSGCTTGSQPRSGMIGWARVHPPSVGRARPGCTLQPSDPRLPPSGRAAVGDPMVAGGQPSAHPARVTPTGWWSDRSTGSPASGCRSGRRPSSIDRSSSPAARCSGRRSGAGHGEAPRAPGGRN